MYRKLFNNFKEWVSKRPHKPLVIRGARQVGKTWLVRQLAAAYFTHIIEINFDETPEKAKFFTNKSVEQTIQLLEIDFAQKIVPGKTLIFLDEIQSAVTILPQLRYFYEKMPELHVIATGSLVDFALDDHEFSMPVGRIEYIYLGPMSFEEFLMALGEDQLCLYLNQFCLKDAFPEPLHGKLIDYLKLYFVIGGLPEAVFTYANRHDLLAVSQVQQSLVQSYQDDFAKYKKKVDVELLRKIFGKIPAILLKKVVYANLDAQTKAKPIANTLHLLQLARVIYRVHHTAGNGVPLAAELREDDYKLLFLDVGLACAMLGLKLTDFHLTDDPLLVNKGSLSEQFIGQHLLYQQASFMQPQLHYWNRQERNSSAEVDFLISSGQRVVPVEVKAGKTGTMKSLLMFLEQKNSSLGLRFNADLPSLGEFNLATPTGKARHFKLISLPLYLVDQTARILTECG